MVLDAVFALALVLVVLLGVPLVRQVVMCAQDRRREESYRLGRLEERRP